jgi:uncharacterized protein YsxB (DUF464 family)
MKLKAIFSALLLCVSFSFGAFSQVNYATALSNDKFVTAHNSGVFNFRLPNTVSKKDVDVSASFYTMYFSVDFSEEKNTVSIKLKENEDRAVHVMGRFFLSLGIKEISYQEKLYTVEDFYTTFLRDGKKR